jgi:transcriptional regulator GlxA family with amidase domain
MIRRTTAPPKPGVGDARITRVVNRIKAADLLEMPTLDELAALARMNRSHFSRRFHAVVGTSLRRYISLLRVQRGRELILTSTLSLTAIAAEAGFYDLPHFDKVFRQRFGMSPREFRARARAKTPRS